MPLVHRDEEPKAHYINLTEVNVERNPVDTLSTSMILIIEPSVISQVCTQTTQKPQFH